MGALTKADLAEELFIQVGVNKREAKSLIDQLFEEIRSSLESGWQVKLSGFGNFNLRDKKQRPGRNPKTGEEIPVSARRVVTFKASQKLKEMVESRKRWHKIDSQWSYFETAWKPKSWETGYRFIFTRKKTRKQRKGMLQLHLFEPRDFGFDYQVIVTNKTESANSVVLFHNCRGSQERIFGDAKNKAPRPCHALNAWLLIKGCYDCF